MPAPKPLAEGGARKLPDMERQYAEALWTLIEKGKAPHEAVAALKKSLEARGRLALLPKIARAFARLAARESGKHTFTLSVARQKDMQTALIEVKKVLAGQSLGEFDLCEQVDETLVGGWRLEGKGLLMDQSWKKALLSIYNRATQ